MLSFPYRVPVAMCGLSQGAGQVPVMLAELYLCCTAIWAVLLSPESFSDSHLHLTPRTALAYPMIKYSKILLPSQRLLCPHLTNINWCPCLEDEQLMFFHTVRATRIFII